WLIVVLTVSILISQSCKRPTMLGEDLIPPYDQLHSQRQDTFTIITTILPDDSAITSFNVFYALGSVNNTDFGKSSAGIYTQVNLPTNNLYLGPNAAVDSIVLILNYGGFYGDSTSTQTVSVYKMVDRFITTIPYFSDAKFHYLPVSIGKKSNFIPKPKDSTIVYGKKAAPALRIKMNDAFVQEFLNPADTTKFLNDTLFTNFLKGLYIETDTLSGFKNNVMLLNLYSSLSGMAVYYHNDLADSLTVLFPILGPKVNTFTHNYMGSNAFLPLTNPNYETGDSLLYVQGLTGLKAYIQIPYLKNLEGVAINKAEITFTLARPVDSIFPPPNELMFITSDSLKKNQFIYRDYATETFISVVDQDIFFSGITYDYGGNLLSGVDAFGQPVMTYKFNLTRHFQKVIQGDLPNNGFMLIVFPGYRIPNSVILGGSGHSNENLKPYLSITYTNVAE
nr:DUF4270 domain-containing protein [Chitinophagales bacterium]MBP8754832.1 DUF4270 domain-containing protein [Chitinophagales bacterium]MBP9705616.1 DUF4270 domain-containing protein [Chitinophagales bacterium]